MGTCDSGTGLIFEMLFVPEITQYCPESPRTVYIVGRNSEIEWSSSNLLDEQVDIDLTMH